MFSRMFGTGSSGLSFGTGTSTSTPGTFTGFNFGSSAAPINPAPVFGGFGMPATTTSGSSLFSGLGTQTTAAPTGSGFGNFGFGGFGAKTTPSFGFGGFGTTTTTTTSGFSGFGSTPFAQGFGAQPQQTASTAPVNTSQALYSAVFYCTVYGDERDSILARWNLLQASWGTGKGYYAQTQQPVQFSQDIPFCYFKAIGYSCLPTSKNEDGLVSLTINKKYNELRNQLQQLVTSLSTLLGNKPNITVCVDGVKPFSDSKTEVVIYVQERTPTGSVRRVPATEVSTYFQQPLQKNQLNSLGVESAVPKVALTEQQLKEYLETPPSGIDPKLWRQAQLDNPDPEHLIPVPMVGFSELHRRMKCQEQETRLHQGRLDLIAEDIADLQRRHTNTVAKIAEYKRKHLELNHRVLQVMVKQEMTRKSGFTIQVEEERLRVQLEALQAELSAPTQFKGRLNELLSQIRMQNQQTVARGGEKYTMDPTTQDDIKQFLRAQQQGLTHLISIIKEDLGDLQVIEEGLKNRLQHR